jgi:hypothetical protein
MYVGKPNSQRGTDLRGRLPANARLR